MDEISLGEKTFVEHAQQHGVKVLLLQLDITSDYRDSIHINQNGQLKLFNLMKKEFFTKEN